MNIQEFGTKSYFKSALTNVPFARRPKSTCVLSHVVRMTMRGLLTGALIFASQSFVQAQTPVLRGGTNGPPVMQFNRVPNSLAESQGEHRSLQHMPQAPQLQQIGREPAGTQYSQPQSASQAFNVQPIQSQNVQLVAERRGFLDMLMPWRRRDNVPQEYEQPVEPPNQYQSSPLPANAATEYGPAMSGFNQRYNRPTTHPGATPPRTAQGGGSTTNRPSTNPPTVRPPSTPPAAPPQSAGTTTTNDGRELPIFQFGAAPRSTGTPLTPPPAPRPEPAATPTINAPSSSQETSSVTPATPTPPIMPLRSPTSILPPVSESSSSQRIDPPAFEDPVVVPESTSSAPALLPGANNSSTTDEGNSAFPPPPSGNGGAIQSPALSLPPQQETTPPAFVPPGAPRIDAPASSGGVASGGPQFLEARPTFTAQNQSEHAPFFASNTQQEETEEDKFARIRERRGQVGLKGFCPVMLRDHRELVDARPEFEVEFNGHTYYVSSLEALEAFQADPAKYAPAVGGSDIIHLDLTGEELPGSLDHAVWYRGRLYMFATAETMETFVAAPAAHRSDM